MDAKHNRKVALAALALVIFLFGISISRLIYPYDVGCYEACVWEPSMLAASGMNPYNHAAQPPFVMAPYGYLYYMTVGLGLKLFGLQLWLGRLLSILGAAIIVICIWRISSSLTKKADAAGFAVIVFLSMIMLQSWIAVQRPDLPGLALAFAGLAMVFGRAQRPDRIGLDFFLIASLFASAYFFKQTFLLPPLVASVRYLQMGCRKQALFILPATAGLCGLGIAALNLSGRQGHFWQSFKLTREIPYSYSSAIQMLSGLIKSPSLWVLFITAGFYFLDVSDRRNKTRADNAEKVEETEQSGGAWNMLRSPVLLLCCYLIVSAALAFVTSSRVGANINYYLESGIIISIIASVVWAQLSQSGRFHRLVPLALLFLTLAGLFEMARVARGEYYRWRSLPYYEEIVSRLSNLTQPQSVSISVYPELVTAANREYHFGDWIQYVDGRSPELRKVFSEAVESRNYPAIIWYEKDSNGLFPGYSLAPINQPIPERFYPVYLYVRSPYLAPQ